MHARAPRIVRAQARAVAPIVTAASAQAASAQAGSVARRAPEHRPRPASAAARWRPAPPRPARRGLPAPARQQMQQREGRSQREEADQRLGHPGARQYGLDGALDRHALAGGRPGGTTQTSSAISPNAAVIQGNWRSSGSRRRAARIATADSISTPSGGAMPGLRAPRHQRQAECKPAAHASARGRAAWPGPRAAAPAGRSPPAIGTKAAGAQISAVMGVQSPLMTSRMARPVPTARPPRWRTSRANPGGEAHHDHRRRRHHQQVGEQPDQRGIVGGDQRRRDKGARQPDRRHQRPRRKDSSRPKAPAAAISRKPTSGGSSA